MAAPDAPAALGVPELLSHVSALREDVLATQRQLLEEWRPHLRRRAYRASAENLAAYIGLRRQDLRPLQDRLAALGLSSLGRCEAHVGASLNAILTGLRAVAGEQLAPETVAENAAAMRAALRPLEVHSEELLGPAPSHRLTRFMVTLPTEAGSDYDFVRQLALAGMNVARINGAHDGPEIWRAMAESVRRAAAEVQRPCRILFDLAGPKMRTGPIVPGPPLLRLKPHRNEAGQVMAPAPVILDGSGQPGRPPLRSKLGQRLPGRLAVERKWLKRLAPGDVIRLRDVRDRRRELRVEERLSSTEILANAFDTTHIAPGTELELRPGGEKSSKTARVVSGAFAAPAAEIRVSRGDVVLLTRDGTPGRPETRDAAGGVIEPARVACIPGDVLACVTAGQSVWIDDGRIGCLIEKVDEAGAWLRVTRVRDEGERIGEEKGLNFPDSTVTLPAITEADRAALAFAAGHADMVGLSYVRDGADVDSLVAALAETGGGHLGIVAKIETRAGVANLPEIIVRGAGSHPFGVMIARGDLAIEIGFERLAEIQEEILWLAQAAHVPVVWATQVLENLVKTDLPTRAEMTDAAMSERAECVMLNKGPYVLDALTVLDSVVTRMQAHQRKKTALFRALHW
ncbi:MAG TPA: pyruvate kinase [Pelomicrobium sp.]|nr:pyruvate kinase [Pelomicrobium sp.]